MTDAIPRMRMFAGPNGSGKSTLKQYLSKRLMGVYLNADELEASIRQTGNIHLSDYGVSESAQALQDSMVQSTWLSDADLSEAATRFVADRDVLKFGSVPPNSYYASVAIEFIRRSLINAGISFTVETVMSHPSKIQWLHEAQLRGCRTYLYYVATDDPEICLSRVDQRVRGRLAPACFQGCAPAPRTIREELT